MYTESDAIDALSSNLIARSPIKLETCTHTRYHKQVGLGDLKVRCSQLVGGLNSDFPELPLLFASTVRSLVARHSPWMQVDHIHPKQHPAITPVSNTNQEEH